ncbi:subtilase-type protease inhibitor [Streptomyces sp. NBC_00249]|uniref:subtilase-type protease inhibitor n=1 Tax=Streptomyces sp. NBC_00249 TaxID=2975690 RepID=UPI0022581C69|nr:subtilase-type protease inhibitor [Streptomyces sp. NBC_00249]MCX5195446.1 subtilase-type protease inhibitor [Streptomyces sp. NBC_00249]
MSLVVRRFTAVSASAVLLCLAGASGVAQAQPTSLYAPSAMVFTVTQGDAATDTVLRASVLSCTPTAKGTHPDPTAACGALKATGGAFERLLAAPDVDRACPMHYDPVTVTADGVWQGGRVAWKHTFSNACAMSATLNGNAVFAF